MLRWRYLATYFRFWFGAIWAAVSILFLVIVGAIARKQSDFERRALIADATVVEKGKDAASDGATRCWLRYTWRDADAREQVGLAQASWPTWRALGDGAPLRVRYLADDPSRNEPLLDGRVAEDGGWILGLLAGGAIGLVGWTLMISALRGSGRRVELVRNGTVTSGTVLGLEAIQNLRINRRNPVYLRVAWKDELGRSHEGESASLPPRLIHRWQTGDPIRVVYDPFDPSRCEVDIFDARAA